MTDLELWLALQRPDPELDRWRAEFQRLLASGVSQASANAELSARIERGERAPVQA